MLTVKTPDEASEIIRNAVHAGPEETETVPLSEALGRVLSEDISASAFVPDFDRSAVDGYAVKASDTFGCSDAIPAVLTLRAEVRMGEKTDLCLHSGECAAVPTGGAMPAGTDAAVMIEYTEDYGDGTIGILKSAAPGVNLILRGDDVYPGKRVLSAGRKLNGADIGALAAMGISRVTVSAKPAVGIISTGDELVPAEETPMPGQVRDVNTAMLCALVREAGGRPVSYGILRDDEELLLRTLDRALAECDVILISGGSSVGTKDATCRVLERRGKVLFHGIAMKPGKPTIFASVRGKPVFGLPGHPVAACFVTELFIRPVIAEMLGSKMRPHSVRAVLKETVSANHGRAQYTGVVLEEEEGVMYAVPVHVKSGLITGLAGTDGFFCVPRDREGISAGETVSVRIYAAE